MNTLPQTRDMKLKANKIVKVVNAGDREVFEMFDGDVYHFPAKSWIPIRAEIAWIWFGRQNLREDPVAWQEELVRVADRVGPKEWDYRKSGKFYCADFGDPVGCYNMHVERKVPSVVAQPLDTMEDVSREHVKAPSLADLHDQDDADLTDNTRVAPRQSRK